MATIKLILVFAVLGALLFVAFKVIPPYFSNYEFEDALKNEALHSTYSTRSEEDIREAVIKQAHDYDIELTPKQVHISRTGGGYGNGSLTIEADYTVDLDLPGYSTTLEFHPSTNNRGVF